MTNSLQDKFQVSVEVSGDGSNSWVSAESQHRSGGRSGANYCPERADSVDPRSFNVMPPGMAGENLPDMPFVLAGSTDYSHDTNPTSIDDGFKRRTFSDADQEKGRHSDLFYGDAGGFVERNNYLDRN